MKETSLFRTILDNVEDGVCFVDRQRRISLWNQAAEEITGFESSEVLGQQYQNELLNHLDEKGQVLPLESGPLYACMEDGTERRGELLLQNKSGQAIPVRIRAIPVYSAGEIVGGVEIFTPIPVVEAQEGASAPFSDADMQKLSDLAMKDSLTGLVNRTYLESQLNHKIQQAAAGGSKFCVLFAEIDDFSVFTRYYGRSTGDVMVQSVSESFKNNITGEDKIGRWDGVLFFGIFDVHEENDPYLIAEKVRMLVARSSVIYQGKSLSVTASVGLTVAAAGESAKMLLSRAENYLNQSFQRGQNCCTIDALPPAGPEPAAPFATP